MRRAAAYIKHLEAFSTEIAPPFLKHLHA